MLDEGFEVGRWQGVSDDCTEIAQQFAAAQNGQRVFGIGNDNAASDFWLCNAFSMLTT